MFLVTSRNRIVQIPENMIARFGSSPMTSGKTNVAPNMATTCWAPTPTVLPQGSRWRGPTASPGWGSTTSHLNIDMTAHPFGVRTGPRPAQPSDPHLTPTTATDAEGTPYRLARLVASRPGSAGDLEHPESHGDVQPQVRVGRQRAQQPLQLRDPVAHRVVVEELHAGRLGHVEVRVQQHLQRLAQVGGLGRVLGQR